MFTAVGKTGGVTTNAIDPYFNLATTLLHGDGTSGATNTSFIDNSTNNHALTTPNGIPGQGSFTPFSVEQGKWSGYFNGSTDYLTFPDSASLRLAGVFTMECWIYPTITSGIRTIAAKGNGTSSTGWVFRLSTTGVVEFLIGATAYSSGLSVNNNAWNHVMVMRDSNNDFYIAVNGTFSGIIVNSTNAFAQAEVFSIAVARGLASNRFTGYISNFRAVKAQVYFGNFTPSTSPLTAVANTVLLVCLNRRFDDISSVASAVTKGGTPSIQPFSAFAPSDAYRILNSGGNGGSAYFNSAATTWIKGPTGNTNFQISTTVDFTLNFWIYPTSYTSIDGIIGYDNIVAGSGGWICFLNSAAGQVQVNFYNAVTPAGNINSGTSYARMNEWSFVSIAYAQGIGATVTVNGVSGPTGVVYNVTYGASAYLGIGRWNYSTPRYFNGYITGIEYIRGSAYYYGGDPVQPPDTSTSPYFLFNATNAGIFDNTAKNDWRAAGTPQISSTQTKYGSGSIYFNGTSYIYSSPTSNATTDNPLTSLRAGNFTIEFWIYLSNLSTVKRPISQGTYVATEYQITINTNGSATFNNGPTALITTAAGTFTTGSWQHVAVVRSGTALTFYVNGISVGTATNSTDFTAVTPIYIGGNPTSTTTYVTGYMDEVRITRYARYTTAFQPPGRSPDQ